MHKIIIAGLALISFALTATSWAWDPDEAEEYHAKAQEAIAEFKKSDPSIQRFFDSSSGYVVIPTVGKAGFGGPIIWKGDLIDTTGTDKYHFQVGLGLLATAGILDAFVEIIPLGERAATFGLATPF